MVVADRVGACAYCGRVFGPGANWHGLNYCRAAYLLPIIAEHPGLSAWELATVSKMGYAEVTKGLVKARAWEVVTVEPEERDAGGIRYRYEVASGWQETIEEWKDQGIV